MGEKGASYRQARGADRKLVAAVPSDPKDLRRPTPVATRVIERRTRARAARGPWELLPVELAAEGVAHAGRLVGRGFWRLMQRLQLGTRAPLGQLPGALGAATVRIRGVVEPLGPVFETPGSPLGVVFARTIFLNQPRPAQPSSLSDELRGVDFHIRLASGERVEVAAADVRLPGAPRRVFRPNLAELERRGGDGKRSLLLGLPPLVREQRLRVGDTVEALGVLLRQIAPGGEAISGRGTPLVTRLVPPPGGKHLWVWRTSSSTMPPP